MPTLGFCLVWKDLAATAHTIMNDFDPAVEDGMQLQLNHVQTVQQQ